MKKIFVAALMAVFALPVVSIPQAHALSGNLADEIDVKVYTEQGDDWFLAIQKETDDDGVIDLKNVLSGKYRFEVDEDDAELGQYISAELRLLDPEGRRINHDTDVDVYVYMSGQKMLAGSYETDDHGNLDLTMIYPGLVYEIDVDDESHLSHKDNRPRIKVRAKIDDSEWFQAKYDRVEDGILEVKNVPSGKYKFKYKKDDASREKIFTLKARLLDRDGEEIDEKTDVKLYAYQGSQRILMGEVETDDEGWVMIPGMLTHVKYKIKVDD